MHIYETLMTDTAGLTMQQRVIVRCVAAIAEQLQHIGNGLHAIAKSKEEKSR